LGVPLGTIIFTSSFIKKNLARRCSTCGPSP
jgi:hypothetical protein